MEVLKINRVDGKVVIVTGGASGIGRSATFLLAKEGAQVAMIDIQDERGMEVVQEIKKQGGKAEFWHLDVSHEKEVETVFAKIHQHFGAINVLVNNAGISAIGKPTHEVTEEELDEIMNTNFKGVFFCTKHVIAYLKEAGGGSIINISSIMGLTGSRESIPYHASKGAIRLTTKADAIHYARDKIRVNSIHPGFIWTPIIENVLIEMDNVEQGRKYLDKLHPVGHIGEPDDIGWGIVYLASDESKFVTGSELVIDGGYTAR